MKFKINIKSQNIIFTFKSLLPSPSRANSCLSKDQQQRDAWKIYKPLSLARFFG